MVKRKKDRVKSCLKKVRYSGQPIAKDGDTICVLHKGEARSVRVLGLDTDELGTRRGEAQAEVLKGFSSKWLKPRLYSIRRKNKAGWPYWDTDAYGRILAKVFVWYWFRYIEYAEYMKKRKMVKRKSKWNK